MKAGSSVSFVRVAPIAAIKPSSSRTVAPLRSAATFDVKSDIASVCTACQRLNGSASWAARKRRSSASIGSDNLIGAEKPRLIEGIGRSATSLKTKVWLGSFSSITPRDSGRPSSVSGRSAPALPTRPMASGITIGCLFGWFGVGGMDCVMSSR